MTNLDKEDFVNKQIVSFDWTVAEGKGDEQLHKILSDAYEKGFSKGFLVGKKISSSAAYGRGLLHGSQK